MFLLDENKSTRNDNFDADELLRKAMENSGMIEKAIETEFKVTVLQFSKRQIFL